MSLPCDNRLDALNPDLAANQKENNAKFDNLQRDLNNKYDAIQKDLTDIKVETATIKTKMENIEATPKTQLGFLITGFISLVGSLIVVLWRFIFITSTSK